jgi:Gram-negative bacterial TonB protein C-terminal
MMNKAIVVCLVFWVAAGCSRRTEKGLCPKHIETPGYAPLARMARLTGKITLTVTIDREGRVEQVGAATNAPGKGLILKDAAVENMRHWTFAKPPFAPYTQVIVYDYEIDPTIPSAGGEFSAPTIVKVTFDLPDQVQILTNTSFIETDESKPRR